MISGILCFTEYSIVADCQNQFENEIEKIYSLVENGEIKSAVAACDKLNDDWQEKSKTVDMFLNHDLMDNISCQISTLRPYLEDENSRAQFYATAENMKKQLQSLKESELPLAENII